MPTTLCVSTQNGCLIGQWQISAPWTALALQEATTAPVLYSEMAGVMTPET